MPRVYGSGYSSFAAVFQWLDDVAAARGHATMYQSPTAHLNNRISGKGKAQTLKNYLTVLILEHSVPLYSIVEFTKHRVKELQYFLCKTILQLGCFLEHTKHDRAVLNFGTNHIGTALSSNLL